MTPARVATELPLLQPPEGIPSLGPPLGALALARPATTGRFLVEGGRASAFGTQRGMLAEVRIDSRLVAEGLTAEAGTVANVILSPGHIRRERIGHGTTLESIVVAPALPLVAIQWDSAGGAPGFVSVVLLPGAPGLDYQVGPTSVTARPDVEDPVFLGFSPPPRAWSATPLDSGGLRVEIRPDTDATQTTLLLSSGPLTTARAAFAAARHLGAHAVRASGPTPQDGIEIVTGVAEIDEGVAWARTRLHTGLAGATPVHASSSAAALLWSGVGALASGDTEAARTALGLLERTGEKWPAALLAGRLASTSGNVGDAQRLAAALVGGVATDGAPHPLRALALRALADGLRYAADDDRIASLRSAASERVRVTRPLPTVRRGSGSSDLSHWLGAALAGRAAHPPPPVADLPELAQALATWANVGTSLESAWTSWRTLLGAALTEGPAGPGTWDRHADPAGGGAPVTGILIATLVHGFLGISPDAPVGRIRIAPRLPPHLMRFRVDGIMVADARIGLDLHREGRRHRFTLRPQAGRVPPLVVFEPSIAGRVDGVRVDGEVAELDVEEERRRSTVSIQLPLDAERTVEITTSPYEDGPKSS